MNPQLQVELAEEKYRLLSTEARIAERTEQLRSNFREFIKQTFRTVSPGHKYVHNWHIDCIAEYLEAMRRGEILRLIINMPPRSLKSISCTIAWPAFLMGHDPSTQIMAASYAQKLSIKHAMDTRLVMRSGWYRRCFPNTIIESDQNEKQKFVTTERGHRMAVSVGASAIGEGGDYLIVDDPLNPTQAMAISGAEREAANDWFGQGFSTRLNDKNTGRILVVMQRLKEDDLSGDLLTKDKKERARALEAGETPEPGWVHLSLQAKFEARQTISIGRFKKTVKKGELLDPIRLNEKVLRKQRVDLGEYGYSGQYQQDPSPSEGGILKGKWWKRYPGAEPPPCKEIILMLDTAFEKDEQKNNDCSAMTAWGIFDCVNDKGQDDTGCLLLGQFNDRFDYPDLKTKVIEEYKFFEPHRILIEKKASGIPLIQELRRAGLPVKGIKVRGGKGAADKTARAHAASLLLERGCVWYMDKDWATEVIEQCKKFPAGAHDDLVDTCTHAWLYLRMKYELGLPEDEEMEPIEEIKAAQQKRAMYGHRR